MILKNGLIMDPGTNASYKADLHIRDGVIAKIGPDLSAAPGEECLDAEGFIIAPGLIDTHTHFRDPGFPHKETLHTGALAAARGGFTAVICMANTSPAVDSVPVLQDILERAKQEGAGLAILQPRSPSCGAKQVYDGTFSGRKIAGMGVFARLLAENGFRILEPEDLP